MKKYITTTIIIFLILFNSSIYSQNQQAMTSKIELLSPDGLHKNPAYSQIAIIEGNNRTIYIGGQNAVDKDGKLVGKGDIEAQAKQILQNLQTAVQAGGGAFENIIKWNIYIVQGQSTEKALKVFQGAMSKMKNPPLITGVFVSSLANPDFLLEMDAIAVVPLK
ncbi:MAG TPA: RidA family protein [Bacteroidia bacterium]|jgi:enamine deaminase RidA (YjgF/YER057c/UK114 family)|nr:RidA family protein [Bacteroidia bacterium]